MDAARFVQFHASHAVQPMSDFLRRSSEIHRNGEASQILMVRSSEALAICLPSGLKATLKTPPPCPFRERISCWLAKSQILTVLSFEPLTRRLLSALKAMLVTQLLWPLRVQTRLPLAESQSVIVLFDKALASHLPSGLNAT